MVKGHNSDLTVRGKKYHVQTEDWGDANPYLVSRVFCNGAVVKTYKVPHSEALRGLSVRPAEALKSALQQQHVQIVDALISGEIS
jgi:hypothetical protein